MNEPSGSTEITKKGRPPVVALFTIAAVIGLNIFLTYKLPRGPGWGYGIYLSLIEIPLIVAFVLSMIFRTRALGLSMASTASIIGGLIGPPIMLVSVGGTPEERIVEQIIAYILSISIWIAAIISVASYCRLDKHKNSFTLYFGMALPFVVWLLWLLIWGLAFLS